MKENALKWLRKAWRGGIIAYASIFITVYGFIWFALEPMGIPDDLNNLPSFTRKRIYYHLIVTGLIAAHGAIIFFLLHNYQNRGNVAHILESFKDELYARIQQMSKQIGEEVNAKLDADSNELYRFYGLKETRPGEIFQNFEVSRNSDGVPISNTNPVSFLWADALSKNSVSAKVISSNSEAFLRIEFHSKDSGLGCNIAVRPQYEKAIKCSDEFKSLYFQARIPLDVIEHTDRDMMREVGIAIRLVNGKYQHWEYASMAGKYIQFPVKSDGTWMNICVDLQDKVNWSHFDADGNPYINENEKNNADLSIISAVVVKVGRCLGKAGELGYGEGIVDIRNIRFSHAKL